MNYAPVHGPVDKQPWFIEAVDSLNSILKEEGGKSPWNLVVLTNHPYHYGPEAEPYPAQQAAIHLPDEPILTVASTQALDELVAAVQQFGKVPSVFRAEWGKGSKKG